MSAVNEPLALQQLNIRMMERAIELAWHGRYTTSPNPNVGCVIAVDDKIVGEGFHLQAGEHHAEIRALKQAGELANGASVYVTLEPCSHFGKTPPCVLSLINAKVKKVYCAMLDPNPLISGNGVKMLQDAGIEVEVGLLNEQVRQLNLGFIKRIEQGLPYVQLKLAASLDGKTALANGKSKWITGPKARCDVQQFRAQASAILSTSTTVIADDASLNVRLQELPALAQQIYQSGYEIKNSLDTNMQEDLSVQVRQPLRVILDRKAKMLAKQNDLTLFKLTGDILVVGEHNVTFDKVRSLQISNDTLDNNGPADPSEDQLINLQALMRHLAKHEQINTVWVEAGKTLAGSLLQAGLVDEVIVYLAPKLIGGDGFDLIGMLGLESMDQVIQLETVDVAMIDQDIRIITKIKNI